MVCKYCGGEADYMSCHAVVVDKVEVGKNRNGEPIFKEKWAAYCLCTKTCDREDIRRLVEKRLKDLERSG